MTNIKSRTATTNCKKVRGLFLLLMLLALLSAAVSAAEQATPGPVLLADRPTISGEPTVIELSVFVIDVDEIDDVSQRFSVDMFVVAQWHDPRLALPEGDRKGQKRFLPIDAVWTPKILLLNQRGVTSHLRQGVTVDDLGEVKFQNRLSGQLAVDLEFRGFPFDVQRLPLDIVSYEYTTDELQFRSGLFITNQEDAFSIEGWQLKKLEPVNDVFVVPGSGTELPRLTYEIEAQRDSGYYTLTMLVPMSLIIFMAWTVFWLQPNIVPSRIAISTAAIFSLIALGVSIRLGLPKVSYLTKADIFVLGCTLMVFLALGVAVISSRLANSERMEHALKINAVFRWVYMLLFIVVWVVAFYY